MFVESLKLQLSPFGNSVWRFQLKKDAESRFSLIIKLCFLDTNFRLYSCVNWSLGFQYDVELWDWFCFQACLSCCMCQLLIQCKLGSWMFNHHAFLCSNSIRQHEFHIYKIFEHCLLFNISVASIIIGAIDEFSEFAVRDTIWCSIQEKDRFTCGNDGWVDG